MSPLTKRRSVLKGEKTSFDLGKKRKHPVLIGSGRTKVWGGVGEDHGDNGGKMKRKKTRFPRNSKKEHGRNRESRVMGNPEYWGGHEWPYRCGGVTPDRGRVRLMWGQDELKREKERVDLWGGEE